MIFSLLSQSLSSVKKNPTTHFAEWQGSYTDMSKVWKCKPLIHYRNTPKRSWTAGRLSVWARTFESLHLGFLSQSLRATPSTLRSVLAFRPETFTTYHSRLVQELTNDFSLKIFEHDRFLSINQAFFLFSIILDNGLHQKKIILVLINLCIYAPQNILFCKCTLSCSFFIVISFQDQLEQLYNASPNISAERYI